jgi:hypothetical protein
LRREGREPAVEAGFLSADHRVDGWLIMIDKRVIAGSVVGTLIVALLAAIIVLGLFYIR